MGESTGRLLRSARSLRGARRCAGPSGLPSAPGFRSVRSGSRVRRDLQRGVRGADSGEKHPGALGAPAAEVFPEAWELIGPPMRGVLTGKGATWIENAPIPLKRAGTVQEAYFTFSYSPVQNDAGRMRA